MRFLRGWQLGRSVLTLFLAWGVGTHPVAAQGHERSDLVVMPGDLISVQVAGEEALTGRFVVDDRGMVVLPLIGVRLVAGPPWYRVRDSLLTAYTRELRVPSVQVVPLRRVTVLGHVNLAGVHLLDPHVTLAEAIATAQGASPEGDLTRIRVVRDGATIGDRVPVTATIARLGIHSGDQIYVGRRGWWDRNSGIVVGSLISAAAILVTALR